ncbi:MAG: glycosyltransferase family 39 protein [Phycisphaerae bacterium]|nr:glycosyltransferase family 39 protein [Phycisphaerae bacterium]
MVRRKIKSPHPRQPVSQSALSPVIPTGLLASILITVLLGGIPFALGRYIEFKSPDPFDSAAYVYSAKHLLDGARMGIDEIPTAHPVTLLINIFGVKFFGFSETGPKIIQTILQTAALVFMFYALWRIFGSAPAAVSTILAAVYLSAPLIAKFGNVKEQYMIALAVCSACSFLLYEDHRKRFWLAACGFFAILPFYCKPTGAAIALAITSYLLISRCISRHWKNLLTEFLLFLGGILIGLVVPASLFIWQKNIHSFLRTFPVVAGQITLVFLAVGTVIVYAVHYAHTLHLIAQLKQIRRSIWLAGIAALLIAVTVSVAGVSAANRYWTQSRSYPTVSAARDVASYIFDIPIVNASIKIYHIATGSLERLIIASGVKGGYVGYSWKAITLSKLAPQVFRYYKALCVPILLALASICTALLSLKSPLEKRHQSVWMLAIWWITDMGLIWVSPHSYEQYYLPLCASGAMLGSFAVWRWQQKLTSAANKMPWLFIGAAEVILLAVLSIPIFIGQRYSPDTGADYIKNYGSRRRGFAEALARIKADTPYPWQLAGDYIRTHSKEQDTIYVWGWVPGIYVRAQRMAGLPKAYEGNMHVTPPAELAAEIEQMKNSFEQAPPHFIVDSRKRHFPFDRPPLELWPMVPARLFGNEKPRLLSSSPQETAAFDSSYAAFLEKQHGPDEAKRYEAMKPLREFVMHNYSFAGQFGDHMVFEKK